MERILTDIDQLMEKTSYVEQALLQAVKEYIKEQEQRIEMMQAELDGQLWSPGGW